MSKGFSAFVLTNRARNRALSDFPPVFPKVVAHHVTYKFGVYLMNTKIPDIKSVTAVGYATDNEGIEAYVVKVGDTIYRPDGKIFHITWSLDPSKGYKPVHSNTVIMENGWEELLYSYEIEVKGQFVPFTKK